MQQHPDSRLFVRLLLVGLCLAGLSACASNPMGQTGQATSTDAAQAIDEAMAEAEQRERQEQQPLSDDVSSALMPSDEATATEAGQDEDRFNVRARDLGASRFFEGLVDDSPYNVVVHPDVELPISMRLDDVTVPEVMEVAADLYRLDIQRNGRLFQVRPGGLQTQVFQVDYLHMVRTGGSETQVRSGQVSSSRDSGEERSGLIGTQISTATESDFWGDLHSSLEMIIGTDDGRRVVTTPGAGMIVVRAEPEELRDAEEYLRRMQVISKRQVILEAKILEVTLDERFEQGIDWSYMDQISSSGPSSVINTGVSGRSVGGDAGGVFSSSLQIGDFNTMIRLLGEQGNVQVLSSPRVSTVNNEKAVIKVGSDEFFVTDIDFNDRTTTGVGGSDFGRSTSVDLTPFFSGISLDVTPQISEDDVITLHMHPAVSEVEDQEKRITIGDEEVTLPLALSTVRETDSIVSARSGQIVVIGGLMQNISEERTSAVPVLSQIPYLGELFKQRRFESRKSELVILLRPVLADEGAQQQDISSTRERMHTLREIMESSETVRPQPAQPPRE